MKRAAVALLLVLGACTSGGPAVPTPVESPPSPQAPIPTGPHSALATMQRLCNRPSPPHEQATPAKNVPEVVSKTEGQVEAVRGLQYERPVAVDAVSHDELVRGIARRFERSQPQELVARQTLSLQTIGAIPKGTSLAGAVHQFLSTQVIGYYDTNSKQLVFQGTDNPTAFEQYTLAHELTHALDDQHFDLSRLDALGHRCRDEALQAATGAVEGSAVYFSTEVVFRFFSPDEQQQVVGQSGPAPTGIPQFVLNMETWPYIAGPSFIAAMEARDGTDAVNQALQHLPVSTEQVMHPSKYPGDVPTPVDIPDLGPKLGKGWSDLDVEEVGEEFLNAWLGLRLDPTQTDPAADGWDGGLLRAWRNGRHVAVVLSTVWDTPGDLTEFQQAVTDWIEPGEQAKTVVPGGNRVVVLFATDPATLSRLERVEA